MRTVLLSILITCGLALPAAADCLKIGIDPQSYEDKLGDTLSTAFSDTDICFTFIEVPINSARTSLKNGFFDGELARTRAYIEGLADAPLVVSPPLVTRQKYLVSVAPISSLDDLRKPMTGFVADATWSDEIFNTYPDLRPVRFETLRSMMAELLTGQLKTALISDRDYENTIALYNLNSYQVGITQRYLLLHPRHADKVTRISEVLAKLEPPKNIPAY